MSYTLTFWRDGVIEGTVRFRGKTLADIVAMLDQELHMAAGIQTDITSSESPEQARRRVSADYPINLPVRTK